MRNFLLDDFLLDDGERLHVFTRGSGPPVVLLHEWASDHSVWRAVVADLAQDHTVYAWDARGHGGHPRLGREPPCVKRMAADLRCLLDHFHIEQPTIIGHSMGALTLWQFIADYGCDAIKRLGIIDQSPRLITDATWSLGIYGDFPAERNAAFIQSLQRDFPETVLRLVADGFNLRAREQVRANSRGIQKLREKLSRLAPEPLIAIWDSLGQADYRSVLPTISVPTLLVYGGASNYYSVDAARYVAQAIPESQLHIFEEADHSPHVACRERFLACVRDFMA